MLKQQNFILSKEAYTQRPFYDYGTLHI